MLNIEVLAEQVQKEQAAKAKPNGEEPENAFTEERAAEMIEQAVKKATETADAEIQGLRETITALNAQIEALKPKGEDNA